MFCTFLQGTLSYVFSSLLVFIIQMIETAITITLQRVKYERNLTSETVAPDKQSACWIAPLVPFDGLQDSPHFISSVAYDRRRRAASIHATCLVIVVDNCLYCVLPFDGNSRSERTNQCLIHSLLESWEWRPLNCSPIYNMSSMKACFLQCYSFGSLFVAAVVVRYLTKRYIGEYSSTGG